MINRLRKKIERGFTLIETLVAIFILSVALTGPLTIASKGLQTALIVKDQTTAYYLAQDAVEYVRFKRDSNTLEGKTWLDGFVGCSTTDGCAIDSVANTVSSCPSTGCPALNYRESKNWFTYESGADIVKSPFTRKVTFTTVSGNADEMTVTVAVSWKDVGVLTRTVVVRENIFKWQ